MLNKLSFRLTVPTHYKFLVRYIKAAQCDTRTKLIAYYFCEKTVPGVPHAQVQVWSMIAASAVYLAMKRYQVYPGMDTDTRALRSLPRGAADGMRARYHRDRAAGTDGISSGNPQKVLAAEVWRRRRSCVHCEVFVRLCHRKSSLLRL